MIDKKIVYGLLLHSCISSAFLFAETENAISQEPIAVEKNEKRSFSNETPISLESKITKPFDPFTGKVSKSKVRLRLHPAYEGTVVKEIEPGELFVVLGEEEDFYAVKPPKEFKAYVFRTFVLDDVIEGNRVNIRLKPDLDAPVIAQFNSGDSAEGVVDQQNPKWLEIEMPEETRFYVAKEYIDKIGGPNYLAAQEKREHEAKLLLSKNEALIAKEMEKPFPQMTIDSIVKSYETLITEAVDFPEIVFAAKQQLAKLQEEYTQRKITYLESQTRTASAKASDANQLNQELQVYKTKVAKLEKQLQNRPVPPEYPSNAFTTKPATLPVHLSYWIPQEEALFYVWSEQTGRTEMSDFYNEQKEQAIQLRGVIEPYSRPVKNKPGDYILVNPTSKLPVAYLYSTQVNLQEFAGHEVHLTVFARPNNHFAYPAYYVFSIDQ